MEFDLKTLEKQLKDYFIGAKKEDNSFKKCVAMGLENLSSKKDLKKRNMNHFAPQLQNDIQYLDDDKNNLAILHECPMKKSFVIKCLSGFGKLNKQQITIPIIMMPIIFSTLSQITGISDNMSSCTSYSSDGPPIQLSIPQCYEYNGNSLDISGTCSWKLSADIFLILLPVSLILTFDFLMRALFTQATCAVRLLSFSILVRCGLVRELKRICVMIFLLVLATLESCFLVFIVQSLRNCSKEIKGGYVEYTSDKSLQTIFGILSTTAMYMFLFLPAIKWVIQISQDPYSEFIKFKKLIKINLCLKLENKCTLLVAFDEIKNQVDIKDLIEESALINKQVNERFLYFEQGLSKYELYDVLVYRLNKRGKIIDISKDIQESKVLSLYLSQASL